MNERWQPSADIETLRTRAGVLRIIRKFFDERDVLEVETPALSRFAATDPQLGSLTTEVAGIGKLYLHVSPEFFMKRLLAGGSGDIWSCCRVYRDAEAGRRHNPEFTMLEWYRLGFGARELMTEVFALIEAVLGPCGGPIFDTYSGVFERHLNLAPLHASFDDLKSCAEHHGYNRRDLTRAQYIDWLFSEKVCAQFPPGRIIFIDRFPAEQAALATLSADGMSAQRFECFIGPVEIANGYHEATDANEIKARLQRDNEKREQESLPHMPADEHLLAALAHGLPGCSGVALGLDRLLMIKMGKEHISEVMAFSVDRI